MMDQRDQIKKEHRQIFIDELWYAISLIVTIIILALPFIAR
jgi:hypothetical protein